MNKQPAYFDIFRALHRGGMSLWLNRRTLMPMTLIPILVTFLTLMVIRVNFPVNGENGETPSAFIMALMQIPSDFVTGIFCSLIIFIIMNAPKKSDKDAPVMFTLNVMERKDLLMGGAIAFVAFSYFAGGLLGVMQMLFDPIQAAAQNEQAVGMGYIIGFFAVFGFTLSAIRFLVLPVLIIGQIDIKSFYAQNKGIGFSFPVFAVKALTSLAVGIVIFMIGSAVASLFGGGENSATPTQLAILDMATSFGSVISSAWAVAALSIGVRKMIEGDED